VITLDEPRIIRESRERAKALLERTGLKPET